MLRNIRSWVYLNINSGIDLDRCLGSKSIPLWSGSGETALDYRVGVYVYLSTIYSGTLSGSAEANFCASPLEILGCLDIKPSVTLYVRGGGDANLAVSQYHAAGKFALSFR